MTIDIVSRFQDMLGDQITGSACLLPVTENVGEVKKHPIHVTREIRLDLQNRGRYYFRWQEHPDLPGHPFALDLGRSSAYTQSSELKWIDMSDDLRWRQMERIPIQELAILEDFVSYENDAASSRVVVGIELRTAVAYAQIAVIQPPVKYRDIPLSDAVWAPSNVVTSFFSPIDLKQAGLGAIIVGR